MPNPFNAICLTIDRWHCGFLGCYGNTWIETPHIDQLAAEGLVLDQALIDGTSLDGLLRSFWQSVPAVVAGDVAGRFSLMELLREAGIHTALLTDEPAVARHPLVERFTECLLVDAGEITRPAAREGNTHLAGLISSAVDWLSQAQQPFLLWIHSQGMARIWDAPLSWRERYIDEQGFEVPRWVTAPRRSLEAGFDPDLLLPIRWSYAAQATLLDHWVGGLRAGMQSTGLTENTLLMLLAARGFPLGEHGQVGSRETVDEPLHEELIHIPWMIRLPEGRASLARSQALAQPADLAPTLLDWWNLPTACLSPWGRSLMSLVSEENATLRDRALLWSSPTERGLRTAAWYLRAGLGEDQQPNHQLYAKPDDRWERNEVSDRCADVVELMASALNESEAAAKAGSPDAVAELPPILSSGLE